MQLMYGFGGCNSLDAKRLHGQQFLNGIILFYKILSSLNALLCESGIFRHRENNQGANFYNHSNKRECC